MLENPAATQRLTIFSDLRKRLYWQRENGAFYTRVLGPWVRGSLVTSRRNGRNASAEVITGAKQTLVSP